MIILDKMVQGSVEWFQARLLRITGTDAKRLVTAVKCEPSASRFDVMAELLAERRIPDDADPEMSYQFTGEKFIGNKYTDHGNEFEPIARQHFEDTYCKEHGLEIREVGMVVHDNNFIACSPDGLIYKDGVLIAGWEAKCKCLKEHIKIVASGELPDEHKQQVHLSMIASGLNEWYFYSYFPDEEPFLLIVERDDYTDTMEGHVNDFIIEYANYKAKTENKLRPQAVSASEDREEDVV